MRFERLYQRERDVYLRLRSQSIVEVAGFAVPQLIHHDDRLWVVEMGIVSPPFVLDFAGAYLDRRPDYPDDVMEEWQAEKLEQFGEERWQIVQSPCQRRTPGKIAQNPANPNGVPHPQFHFSFSDRNCGTPLGFGAIPVS